MRRNRDVFHFLFCTARIWRRSGNQPKIKKNEMFVDFETD